jgi:hypothetical protein
MLSGLLVLTVQGISNGLTVSDTFDTATVGDSIAGRLTEAGGSTWMVQGGTVAVVGSDGAVSSGGLSGAAQASIALRSPNRWQYMYVTANVLVTSGDDYVGLGILPTTYCGDDWGNLGLPSLRLHPNGAWDMYGLSGGTIAGFDSSVPHKIQLVYHYINKNFKFYLDGVLIQDQYIWQSWTNQPNAIGFRINSTATGASKIYDFSFSYTSDITSYPVVSKSSFSISKESNTTSFTVSNGGEGTLNWTATSNASWLIVSPSSGTDTTTVTATCEANTTPFYRDGVINITASGQTAKVKIRQAAADVSASLFADDFTSFDTARWNNYTTQDAIDAGYFSSTPASRDAYITAEGQLALPINAGDVYGGTTTFSNVIVTPAPTDWQAITVKIKGSTAFDDTMGWNQFNLLLWNDEDNHVKIGFQSNDTTNSGNYAGHITAVYGIETGANRWFINQMIDDGMSNAYDMTLRIQKNTDGTYKYSVGIGDGAVTAVTDSSTISFASSSGAVQTPKYLGLYACAGRNNDTTTWGAYDPTANRNVDVLVDQFIVSGSGDANYDGAVDVGDLGILAANYGSTGMTWEQGDFNGDGTVDVGDLGILAANYGQGSSAAADFDTDYAKVFGTAATSEDDTTDDTSVCSSLGLSLIAGMLLMGMMLVKLEE